MNKVSTQTEQKIIEYWFQGLPRDEIASKLDVSGSTVSAIINSFPTCLAPLRDLAKLLKKLNCDPKDALEGLVLRLALLEIGASPDQISLLIAGYKKVASANGCEVEKLSLAAVRLEELENQADCNYKEALDHFEDLNAQNSELENENGRLMIEIKKNEAHRVETLKLANVSSQEASEYRSLKFEFKKRGMNLQDAEAIKTYVDNMKQSGLNPIRFIAMCNKSELIKKLLHENKMALDQVQTDLSRLEPYLEAKRAEANFLENQVACLRDQEQKSKYTLDTQYNQCCRLQSECNHLSQYRKELIAQIGRIVGMSELEIASLQIDAHAEIIKALLDTKSEELVRKLSQRDFFCNPL